MDATISARTAVGQMDAAVVRSALRNYDRPSVLASSPLAAGATSLQRATSVRALLDQAVESAFGTSSDECLQREAVVLGYLDPTLTHEAAAHALHLSRASYFRRLRQAVERVAEWVILDAGFPAASSGRRAPAALGRRAAA
jgi:hypothetical protein